MPALGVAHEHVVCLVEDVRPVPVRSVLLEVDVLVHVRVDRVDVVFRIPLVEGGEHLLQMPRLGRHLVVEHADGGVLFDFAVEFCHDLLIGECAAARALGTACEHGRRKQQSQADAGDFSSFHCDPSLSITA